MEDQSERKKRRGWPQRRKTEGLTIHQTPSVAVLEVLAESRFKGYRRYSESVGLFWM